MLFLRIAKESVVFSIPGGKGFFPGCFFVDVSREYMPVTLYLCAVVVFGGIYVRTLVCLKRKYINT